MYQSLTTTATNESDSSGQNNTPFTPIFSENTKLTNIRREAPTRGCALQLSIVISSLTICGGIIASLSQFVSIISRLRDMIRDHPTSLIFQLYGLAFSIIVIFVELDATDVIRSSLVFQSWTLRGFLYAFLGLFVIEVHSGLFPPNSYLYLALLFSGPYMCCIGFIYIIMGLVSLKRLRDQQLAKYVQLLSQVQFQNISMQHYHQDSA